MICSTHCRLKSALLASTLLGSLFLASCSSQLEHQSQMSGSSPAVAPAGDASVTESAAPTESTQTSNQAPQSRPQLVKTAEITLLVNSIDQTLQQVSQIVKQRQGDVLGLQNEKPQNSSRRETASMQIRVPQAQLETTLDALAKLGTVQGRHLSSEDVSTQLVDFQARLRNLRKTESSLLEIMNRSGSVGDVLKVTQELSKIRESIEQIDAQLKNLTNRVAYSTITLRLEAAVAASTSQPLGSEIENTWQNATHSVSEFTSNLIALAIWLIAYSPYLLGLGGVTFLAYTRLKKQQPSQPRERG